MLGKLFAPALAIVLGVVVMIGWLLHIPEIVQVFPGFVPMQFNTALCFALSGASVLAALYYNNRDAAFFISLIPGLIGTLTMFQYSVGVDLHIDEIFITHLITDNTPHPGRMAPNTALCFVLVMLCLIMRDMRKTFFALVYFILFLSSLSVTGYLTGVPHLYFWGNEFTAMAIHTSVGFFLLGLHLLIYCKGENVGKTH
jgi:hypothetical protein